MLLYEKSELVIILEIRSIEKFTNLWKFPCESEDMFHKNSQKSWGPLTKYILGGDKDNVYNMANNKSRGSKEDIWCCRGMSCALSCLRVCCWGKVLDKNVAVQDSWQELFDWCTFLNFCFLFIVPLWHFILWKID